MRSIQHKKEAYWFYRFVSPLYDRWVNPCSGPAPARRGARAGPPRRTGPADTRRGRRHRFLHRGHRRARRAGPGDDARPEPRPARRARRKPALAGCAKLLGDAERLPFEDDSFDRYVSCGSIEYWPDPARAIAEAHRVVRPGGTALVVGPLPPGQRLARLLADTWMLFPTEAEYRRWFEAAGFADIEVRLFGAPWNGDSHGAGTGWRSRAAPPSRVRRPRRRSLGASRRALDGAPGPALRRGRAGGPGVRAGRDPPERPRAAGGARALPAGGGPLTVDASRRRRQVHRRDGSVIGAHHALALLSPAHADRHQPEHPRDLRDRRDVLPGVAVGDGLGDLALTLLAQRW